MFEAMAKISGIPAVRWARVPHPLGSATPDVLRDRALEAVKQFAEIVVANPEA